MNDLISRQDAIKDAESWVAVDEYEKHLKEIVIEWLKEFSSAELSTNLAEVGTDCISRQAAIDAICSVCGMESDFHNCDWYQKDSKYQSCEEINSLRRLPSAQPEIIRCKDCKHHWVHKCMDSMPIERCDLEQTFYDAEVDFCSLAEKREVTE